MGRYPVPASRTTRCKEPLMHVRAYPNPTRREDRR
jgi:hypothetical protein